jgi:LuxR family quorum-sensing system transcriptional regulator CciR
MRRLIDRFMQAAQACERLDQLQSLMCATTKELGFRNFALLDHLSLYPNASGYFRIDNYPQEWVQELLLKNLLGDDPVHLASRRSNCGFRWSELGSLVKLERRHKNILARSRYYGIGDGFTVPANVPGEPSASCSFVVSAGAELPLSRLHCAELVGAHALRAARRLRQLPPRPQRPPLSRRELQCLRLVVLGKTDREIGNILGFSTETAHYYVKRARAAYGSVSRAQLVAHCMRDEWIIFEDAIPQMGE